MTGQPERKTDWTLATWKGNRLQQHREFYALPFPRKLEVIEEMCGFAQEFAKVPTTSRVARPPRPEPDEPSRKR